MILKAFRCYLPLATRLFLPKLIVPRVMATMCSKQETVEEREAKPMKNGPRKSKEEKDKSQQVDLTGLLRHYRTRMEGSDKPLAELTHHCKKIADYYKKINHAEFTQQKAQLESLLITLTEFNYTGLLLTQYFGLLDFVRICGYLETLSAGVVSRAHEKVCSLLKSFDKKVEQLGLEELSTLYCKVTPLYHPDAFKISGLLHDLMAGEIQQKQKLSLSLMQLYVMTRSMGKKEFLSFPDKKILEMILLSLKERNIDSTMIIQLAVALKDLQVEVNISDYQIFGISRNIQQRALNLVEKGLPYPQIQYLMTTKKSDNPYFARIFTTLARKSLNSLTSSQKLDFREFRHFSKLIPFIPKTSPFSSEDRRIVIDFLERYYESQHKAEQRKKMDLDLLELIRNGFFGEDLHLVDKLFNNKVVSFIWSFPVEYSQRGIPFPLEVMESKITSNTSIFRLQNNNIKIAVALAVQARLQPSSAVLAQAYQAILAQIQKHQWSIIDLEQLLKFAVYDIDTIKLFHQEFSNIYLPKLIPTKEQIKEEKQLRRGERSSLLRFWEYILIQDNPPLDLIAKLPESAIFLTCYREKKIKNQQVQPKRGLLLAISLRLASGKIEFSSQESLQIVDLLINYSGALPFENERIIELYFTIVGHLIDQYGLTRKTSLPYVNYLIGKLLAISDSRLVNSKYYEKFLNQLVQAIGLLTISPSYSYLKTSVIRQGLLQNLISDSHLSQLDIAYFTSRQRNLLLALLNRYEETDDFNHNGLLSLFKLQRLPESTERNFDRIVAVIQESSIQQLYDYLAHYSFQNSQIGSKLLQKICEEFLNKFQLGFNLLAVLRNISQLANTNNSLYKRIISHICSQLAMSPGKIYLADHFQVLKLIHQHSIQCPDYEQALAAHSRSYVDKSTAFTNIIVELALKSSTSFPSTDVDIAQALSVSSPSEFLKLIVIHEESIDFAQKAKQFANKLSAPLPQSLYVEYLESKCNFVLAKGKNSNQVLKEQSLIGRELLKQLQIQGVKVKAEPKVEPIYRLTDNIILFFLRPSFPKEQEILTKMMSQLYPGHHLFPFPTNWTTKEASTFLQQLHKTDSHTFSAQVVQSVESALQG